MSEGEFEVSGAEEMAGEGEQDCPSRSGDRRSREKVARVRCLDAVKARGFTFARGKVVEGVPLAHAEYLASGGKVEILEVSVL